MLVFIGLVCISFALVLGKVLIGVIFQGLLFSWVILVIIPLVQCKSDKQRVHYMVWVNIGMSDEAMLVQVNVIAPPVGSYLHGVIFLIWAVGLVSISVSDRKSQRLCQCFRQKSYLVRYCQCFRQKSPFGSIVYQVLGI